MPQQETFAEFQSSGSTIVVLKSYDARFAREVFDGMDEGARFALANHLRLSEAYELDSALNEDDIWEGLAEHSREHGDRFSFFIVQKTRATAVHNLYVSADWPSAERFARDL